jgi:hypothetical protein
VLHVTWQTRDGVDGQHLISLLYRNFLVLASAEKAAQLYNIRAIIGLSDVKVEEVDNGRGMSFLLFSFLDILGLPEKAW